MTFGRLVVAGLAGACGAVILDRWLARSTPRASGTPPIVSRVVIDAPIDEVWAVVSDVERQPAWMTEMKSVRLTSGDDVGVGTRGEATVRILGIAVTDPVEITTFEPPFRFGVRHLGLFTGEGLIRLEPFNDGEWTEVRWEERLVPPLLPFLGAIVQRPILGRIFQSDLERLRDLVEAGPAVDPWAADPSAASPGPAIPPGFPPALPST